jgi:hypothetical protein
MEHNEKEVYAVRAHKQSRYDRQLILKVTLELKQDFRVRKPTEVTAIEHGRMSIKEAQLAYNINTVSKYSPNN